jgi:alanine racemase
MTPAAYATINLDAVKHNIKKIRDYAPQANVMAVIKANAYGHGLLRIARILNDVDAVAVARINEAVTLRKAGFNKRIVILEGFVYKEELLDLIQYNLDVVVHSVEQVDILEKYVGNNRISVWLKHDTGMNRLGFKALEFESAYQRLLACSCINKPISLMTHFSSADNINSPVTRQQIKFFTDSVKDYPGEKSMANSAGIIDWPDSISGWVRPGVMLYGVSPFRDRTAKELGIKPVMSLYSRLIAVKNINQGEAVGYSETWVSEKKARIGVVAIGYGDGYPRYAQIGTPVLVNGKRVPLVGRVSVDMITVDLSDQEDAKLGDPVTLWGDGLAVEEIAKYADTIPYTLLCGITQRVELKNV